MRSVLLTFLFALTLEGAVFQGPSILDGKALRLETKPKSPQVVVFLSARCPCSRDHESALKELKKEFPDVPFVGVLSNADEDAGFMKSHYTKSQLPFPILYDPKSKIADHFRAVKTPHAYVQGPGGEILYQGGIDDSRSVGRAKKFYLKWALEAVSQGKKPEIAEMRTLGCYIQRP